MSEQDYHTTKFFTANVLAIEMKKNKKQRYLWRKPVYLGLSILELSKILMHEFWYDYVKPKHGEKAKLCYMDTEFMIFIKTYQKILKLELKLKYWKLETKILKLNIDTSNYELDSPSPKGKNKKVIRLMKDELVRKFMTKFVRLRAKTYSCLTDNCSEDA